MTTPSIAPNVSAAPSAARPIRARDRRTGQSIALVPSSSRPNLFHLVCADRCYCIGFQATGRCRHLRQVQAERGIQSGDAAHLAVKRAAGEWPTGSPEVAAKAAEYHAIFGSDE